MFIVELTYRAPLAQIDTQMRPQTKAIMAEDPFCRHGLADVRIIEFRASQRADDIPGRVA